MKKVMKRFAMEINVETGEVTKVELPEIEIEEVEILEATPE